MMTNDQTSQSHKAGLSYVEFVFLIGALTSIIALAIDMVLPALVGIGAEFDFRMRLKG